MRQKLLILFAVLLSSTIHSQCNEFFISEVVEGWFNNKAIEIYNPTNSPKSLNGYGLVRFTNGSSTYGNITLLDGYSIAPHDVFVVVLDKRDSLGTQLEVPVWDELQSKADIFVSPNFDNGVWAMYFNGNDAIALVKNNGQTLVDLFGRIGEGTGFGGWSPLGTIDSQGNQNYASKDHTLIRKTNVSSGITTNPSSFDVFAQYDTLPANTFSNLGCHIAQCGISPPCLSWEQPGCTTPQACNFNPSATQDNGSCLFIGTPCNDNNNNTYNDIINSNCTCIGTSQNIGCTNPQACNFNPSATQDNGSCILPQTEICDNLDNNCNGSVDESCVTANFNTFTCESAVSLDNQTYIYPDTVVNFSAGILNTNYEQGIFINPPSDAGIIDPAYSGYVLSTFTLQSITYNNGIPISELGLSATCSPSNCTFPPNQLNCITLSGQPSQSGVFNIELNIVATVLLFGFPIPVDYSLTGYELVIVDSIPSPNIGCTNPQACNFNPSANQDNGTCVLPQTEICDSLDNNCNGSIDENCISTNFNTFTCESAVSLDNQTYIYPDTTLNFSTGILNSYYEQGIFINPPSDAGIIDPAYSGYVLSTFTLQSITYNNGIPISELGLSATCNPSNCTYPPNQLNCITVSGQPSQAGAFNIELNIVVTALVFGMPVPIELTLTGYTLIILNELPSTDLGCTNPQACNYNPTATQDNGSCLIIGTPCNDNNNNTYNDIIDSNCTCFGTSQNIGCTNPQACNFNPSANQDNGSCLVIGSTCNDGNNATVNDIVGSSCTCAGTPTDLNGNNENTYQGLFYQAVARNADGTPMANQNISIRFSLHQSTANGTLEYQEVQNVSSNAMGLFTTFFGTGQAVIGNFSNIQWGVNAKYLQVEMDINGWQTIGTQQLAAVPYAIRAKEVDAGGLKLQSPNGNCYILQVNNNGSLSTLQVPCD